MIEKLRQRVRATTPPTTTPTTTTTKRDAAPIISAETVALAQELLPRAQKLGQGSAGMALPEVAGFVDQFRPLSGQQRQMLRALVLDEAHKSGAKKVDPALVRGEATPQRLVGLLSGEVFGQPRLPTSAKEAVQMLSATQTRLFALEDEATAAQGRLMSLPMQVGPLTAAQRSDVTTLREVAQLRAQAVELRAASAAFSDLHAEGKTHLAPRVKALLQQQVSEGGPTLGALVDDAARGVAQMPVELVPAVLDRLLDLNALELRSLRRTMVPHKSCEQRYQNLGNGNPLKGRTTPDNLLQMLAGVGNKQAGVPTTPEQFRKAIGAAIDTKDVATAVRLSAVAGELDKVPRNRGFDDSAFMFELSVRSGKKGVYSYGYERFFEIGKTDRHTKERSTSHYNAVFLRTAITLNTYTWSEKHKGAEFGVNLPFTYASMGNPVLGPRAGIYIPLVGNATISGTGTVGAGVVLPTPIPGLSVGVNLYVTDPRLLTIVDPLLDATLRGTRALRGLAQPLLDVVADWQTRRDAKVGKDIVTPLRLRLQETGGVADSGESTSLSLAVGESIALDLHHCSAQVSVDGQPLEIHLLPPHSDAPVQIAIEQLGPKGVTVSVDGERHTLACKGPLEQVALFISPPSELLLSAFVKGKQMAASSKGTG